MAMADEIRITAQPDTNPHRFRFTIDRQVWKEHAIFPSREEAERGSPLALKLFDLGHVAKVEFNGRLVYVTQDGAGEWMTLAKQVGTTVRAHLQSGETIVREGYEPKLPPDESLRLKVQNLVDTDINPSIAMHGGWIEILDVRDSNVYVKMGGGCQGCGMADVTLKQGVERMIKDSIPEVVAVLDTTDHASGGNPYYSAGKG